MYGFWGWAWMHRSSCSECLLGESRPRCRLKAHNRPSMSVRRSPTTTFLTPPKYELAVHARFPARSPEGWSVVSPRMRGRASWSLLFASVLVNDDRECKDWPERGFHRTSCDMARTPRPKTGGDMVSWHSIRRLIAYLTAYACARYAVSTHTKNFPWRR